MSHLIHLLTLVTTKLELLLLLFLLLHHDLVFEIYGNILGLPPESLPPLVARAIAVDSLIVFAIIGFRKRKQIAAWWQARQSAARASA